MSATLSIRRAGPADAVLITELSRRTFYDAFAAQNTPENMDFYMDKAFTQPQLSAELEDTNAIFLLAFAGDEPAGYAKLRKGKKPESIAGENAIELQRLYVQQTLLGRQVGPALMERCLKIATEQGYETMWLGVWEKNPRAIAFYKKWDFEVFDWHLFQMGNEAQRDWLMKRPLK